MPRRKEVEMDGAKFTISPLTLSQVEQLVQAKDQVVEAIGAPATLTDGEQARSLRSRMYELVVCNGLNNALPKDAPESDRWTVQRVEDELDMVLVEFLQKQILGFSKLEAPEGAQPGQAVRGEEVAAPPAIH